MPYVPRRPACAEARCGGITEEAAVQPPEAAMEKDKNSTMQPAVPLDLQVLILKRLCMAELKCGEITLARKAVEEKMRDLFLPGKTGYVEIS